jgi:murein DD-endopeptidase MepM/ murein hydrolase activator NlpD
MQSEMTDRLAGYPWAGALDRTGIRGAQASAGGKAADPARLREAANEFEAMFLSYLLNVMRETIEEAGFGEKALGSGIYTELFDQELARSLAAKGALGISDMLVHKLGEPDPAEQKEAGVRSEPTRSRGATPAEPGREPAEVPDFRMPVLARVSSGFGTRRDPFTHSTRFHNGIDIAAPAGMSVRSAGAGRVTFSGYRGGFGNLVILEHPGGYETRYAHLEKILVKEGEEVPAGHPLGTVGSTGRSTGPHLHFEVRHHGDRVDPKALLAE